MSDQIDADAGDTGEKYEQPPNVKPNEHMIPKSRFGEINEKRKAAVQALEEIAEGITDTLPDEMQDLIPDMPPAERIKWIQKAKKQGFFRKTEVKSGLDSKRPGDKPPTDFEGMSPQAIMSMGYKT